MSLESSKLVNLSGKQDVIGCVACAVLVACAVQSGSMRYLVWVAS